MSHFVTMVIGDDPEAQLAPYSEILEVNEYCVEKVSEHDKQRMLDYYNENRQQPYTSFDKCYADNGEDWNGNIYRKNEAGEWCEYSTYNPESKWDWYLLGGRWRTNSDHEERGDHRNRRRTVMVLQDPRHRRRPKERHRLRGHVPERRSMGTICSGQRRQMVRPRRMGWWGVSHDNMPDDEWVAKVQELIESLPDDALVSIYDCHI
nr:MAG TPA: hypothetical protein [Caudoviricetes sp.]